MADEILSTYQQMIDSADSYAKTQADIQNQMTEQTINEINQNKDRTERDYVREQKGSYADYQREIDKYGANGEQIVSSGLAGSGYQESTKVNAFNTWQNRIMVARDSFNQAMTDYNNQIANARLQNSAKQAEIAQQALQQRLSVTLQMLQYQQAQEKARASAYYGGSGGTNININNGGGSTGASRDYKDETSYSSFQANNNQFAIDDVGTSGSVADMKSGIKAGNPTQNYINSTNKVLGAISNALNTYHEIEVPKASTKVSTGTSSKNTNTNNTKKTLMTK